MSKRCRYCSLPWPGDDAITVDDLRAGAKADMPVCLKAPPKDQWFVHSGINGHMFDEEVPGARDHSIECDVCGQPNGGFDDLKCECTVAMLDAFDTVWRLRTLAANLAIGAALCRAFSLGGGNALSLHFTSRDSWFPGCSRNAP